MDDEQKRFAYATFLGIASRDLREGRYLHAWVIFGSLAKVNFPWQRDAQMGEATAQARMGLSREAFTETKKRLKAFVRDNAEPTVIKADNLKSLAEVCIALGDIDDELDRVLQDAADIYSYQGLTKANASIIHLQGLVALWRGDVEEAMKQITWASLLSEVKIPEIVPSGFGIEPKPEPSVTPTTELVALAARSLN